MFRCVDGKKIAHDIQNELKQVVKKYEITAVFHMVYVGSDPVIDNYLKYKQRFAEGLGIQTKVHRFSENISFKSLQEEIEGIVACCEPMIIQLPLPDHMDTQAVLDLVPASLDVDVLSSSGRILFAEGKSNYIPPVTASVLEVCKRHNVVLKDINIVLVGEGTLVGKPMGIWLTMHGYLYDVITKETDMEKRAILLKNADLIISGAGVPHLVKPSDVKQGVVIIDAGTSEAQAVIQGDVDPEVQEKSSLFTPVPGGIGPMTIALLYTNVIAYYHHD